jgi:hypothetical protein
VIARLAVLLPIAPLLALASIARGEGSAPVPPVASEATGTSSIAAIPEAGAGYRVEPRAFRKKQSLLVRGAFTYLSRGDFWASPGVGLDLAYYPDEALGVDLVSATLFFSELTSSAATLRRETGLLPDSQKPIARLTTGGRVTLAYGKLFVEALDTVIHMDANLALHGGVLITDKAPNLGGDVDLALQAAAFSHLIVWIQAGWFLSYERRTTSALASGLLTAIGVGVLL